MTEEQLKADIQANGILYREQHRQMLIEAQAIALEALVRALLPELPPDAFERALPRAHAEVVGSLEERIPTLQVYMKAAAFDLARFRPS